ncbi:MAG: DUF262 domain-containing protein [Caldilineaceae bacterium]|nr:DUF262 domain-containing protein [Caldilineaceae bacterium]
MAFDRPITIKEALDHIHNNRFLLPAFRREFVWRPHQIERLFDSLMRGYPIGSFLFWRVDPETAKNHSFCQFITNYDQRKPHNPVHRSPSTVPGLTAVLDGQQRLTALNIGLRGSIARKLPRLWQNNPRALLYLNLLAPRMENEEGLSFKFSFLPKKEVKDRNRRNNHEHWYLVGDILDIKDASDLIDVVHDLELSDTREPLKILIKLHHVVHSDGIISAYEVADQNPERVLNIFVCIHQLSYSDMLLSTAVAQWDKIDARKEIHALVDEIKSRSSLFNHDFVLKACLMLGDCNSIQFEVENFGKSQIGTLQDQWDRIRSTIMETVELASSLGYLGQGGPPPLNDIADLVELASSFGYSRQSLTSADALLPIAYFLHHCQPSLDTKDRKVAIRDWLIRSLLKRGFWSSGVDNLLMAIRRAIQESSCPDGFPARAIEEAMPSGKSLTFDDEELQDLADTEYGAEYGGRAYILLLLLYDIVDVATNHFHITHIFPPELMTEACLKQAGISEEKIPEYLDRVNRLANLQLLKGSTNTSKGAKIPEIEEFLDFYEMRRRHILEKLRRLLASDSTEPPD